MYTVCPTPKASAIQSWTEASWFYSKVIRDSVCLKKFFEDIYITDWSTTTHECLGPSNVFNL